MVTANFNTKIECDGVQSTEYDLTIVITTSGFIDGLLKYSLVDPPKGVIVKDNLLSLEPNIYGTIVINVSDEQQNTANAITDITGFYAQKASLIVTKSFLEVYDFIRKSWSSIISSRPDKGKKV